MYSSVTKYFEVVPYSMMLKILLYLLSNYVIRCSIRGTSLYHILRRSGIWDGKNDSTIGNEMVSEWTDSGKWDRRKSVKVGNGNGMGSEWADSGTGREWDGIVHLAVGRETREHKSVTGEVGKHRSGKEIPQPFPFPYRSRTVPTTFPVPTFTARSPGKNVKTFT